MNFRIFAMLLFFCAAVTLASLISCEYNDYFFIPETLVVNHEKTVAQSETVSQDNFVRYELNYALKNLKDSDAQFVIGVKSYANGKEKHSVRSVKTVSASSSARDLIPVKQIGVANGIEVSLACCGSGLCEYKEVICPTKYETTTEDVSEISLYCAQHCNRIESCDLSCPSDDCDKQNIDNLRLCAKASDAFPTCAEICADKSGCSCTISPSCKNECRRTAESCYGNCVTVYGQCAGFFFIVSDFGQFPCEFCRSDKGLCSLKEAKTLNEITVLDSANQVVDCSYDCKSKPGICYDACEKHYGKNNEAQSTCLAKCISLYQIMCWAGNNAIDILDYDVQQPCCYNQNCAGELEAAIVASAVECYSNADCGSTHICAPYGECIENKQYVASCSTKRMGHSDNHAFLFLLLGSLLSFALLRKKWRVLAFLFFLVVLPSEAFAAPILFKRARGSFVVGTEFFDSVIGDFGKQTNFGLGLFSEVALQTGYWGGFLHMGTSLALTSKKTLPYDQGLRFTRIKLGPRFVFPTFRKHMLFITLQPEAGVDLLISNTMAGTIGNRKHIWLTGGSIGVQYFLDSVLIAVGVGTAWQWQVSSLSVFGTISVGLGEMIN